MMACAPLIVLCAVLLTASPGLAASLRNGRDPDTGRYTGLPIPRYASLRADAVNLRRGPGLRYPIDWQIHRRLLPVQVLREFHNWRLVRLPDGTKGWLFHSLLSADRSFVVRATRRAVLRRSAEDWSTAVAVLEQGVVGRLLHCEAQSEWCRVQAGGHRGYLRRERLWGVGEGEAVGG